MNNKKNDYQLLLVLFALCALGAAYFFGYVKLNEQATALSAETQNLRSEYARLISEQEKTGFYQSEVERVKAEIEELLHGYGVDSITERDIMFIKDVEKELEMEVSYLSFPEPSIVNITGNDAEGEISIDTILDPNAMLGINRTIGVTFSVSYSNIKSFLDYISNHRIRMTVENVSITYNEETQKINGEFIINSYTIVSGGNEIPAVYIPPITVGKDNVFSNSNGENKTDNKKDKKSENEESEDAESENVESEDTENDTETDTE